MSNTMARLLAFGAAVGLTGCFGGFPRGLPPDAAPPDMDAPPGDGRLPDDMGRPDVLPDVPEPDMPPPPETCNGVDDDGDGAIDETFPVDEACRAGVGACEGEGTRRCTAAGDDTECVVELEPTPERCNTIDDDCDGSTDEDFAELGAACTVGDGVCGRMSTFVCADDGEGVRCPATAEPGSAEAESCNGLDDDCDGTTDEGLVRACDVADEAASGICAQGLETCVFADWGECEPTPPGDEVCNGIDDDCDRRVDEGFFLDQVCPDRIDLQDGCAEESGIRQCGPEGGFVCIAPPEVLCDGIDDNCDGVVDDGAACAPLMASNCGYWLAWSTRPEVSPSPDWGGCVVDPLGEDYSCNGTRAADQFASVSLPVDIDAVDGDLLGVALRCENRLDATTAWIAQHCRLYLGLATPDAAPADGAEDWGPCPGVPVGGDDTITCTSSGDDGSFLPMPVEFDVTRGTALGVAFRCVDPDDPARATAATAAIEVQVAWAATDGAALADEDWARICRPPDDGRPDTACVSTGGDGRFHRLDFTSDVGPGHTLAIMVRPR